MSKNRDLRDVFDPHYDPTIAMREMQRRMSHRIWLMLWCCRIVFRIADFALRSLYAGHPGILREIADLRKEIDETLFLNGVPEVYK